MVCVTVKRDKIGRETEKSNDLVKQTIVWIIPKTFYLKPEYASWCWMYHGLVEQNDVIDVMLYLSISSDPHHKPPNSHSVDQTG